MSTSGSNSRTSSRTNSTSGSDDELYLGDEYTGIEPPSGVYLPKAKELLHICSEEHPRGGPIAFPYPPPKHPYSGSSTACPSSGIKYLLRRWHTVSFDGLAHLCGHRVFFYAMKSNYRTYIVMEYIPGKTAGECLEEAKSQEEKEAIHRLVALGLSELHRIPVAAGARPAAITGGKIRHTLFDEQQAPIHYRDANQLEEHLDLWLVRMKRQAQVCDLSREPMVFCQSDLFPGNFMIEDGRVTVIDLSDVSILPSSFAKFSLYDNRLGFDLTELVYIPVTEGVDNTFALLAASGPMVMGPGFFARLGRGLPGGDVESQNRLAEMIP